MFVSSRLAAVLAVTIALFLAAPGARADLYWGFESGRGHNGQAIDPVPNLTFRTTGGNPMFYADIDSGWYGVTSDNGKVYDDGEYFVSGNVAAYVSDPFDKGKISFNYGTAGYFTVGYSSQFAFTLEAYDDTDQLIDFVTGPANTKSVGGAGLQYLTISCPDPIISYVVLHDHGGFWMIDNIQTDAPAPEPMPTPEPASVVALGMALAGLMLRRRKG